MPKPNWTWLIIGILAGIFVVPFVIARLGGRGGAVAKNKA